ncbi:L-lactate permease [Campylobacter pinnipediorum]|uniref:L-lactate permease n=2 Tax=Campylobacter TaxID=194 RepID=A0AAX0L8T0_9BACT|nr:lactate permease LctP family transporter [Campylobacter pinnipediorum]AQW82927.1 L-lactate permease [Campylobacter pinnipediorum subsp. pinnipediorum]OPA77269.1 L-lactate permease [Campylobacter pinnipediorum subsp. pinnipediorum]
MELYRQIYDPFSNIWLSAFVAALPIFLFFVSLVVLKLKGYVAAFLTVALSLIIAIIVYKMPIAIAIMSFFQGFFTGLWPIAWIILTAIFLYKLSVKSGYFETLKASITTITPDHRVQVVIIALCFGTFLEGAIGFGAPVAITAALLVGLGLNPLYAAGFCMIANTAPAAFGAVGIPIVAMAQTTGIDENILSMMVGRMLPIITLSVPFFIVFLMDGFKGVKQTFLPLCVVASSYTIVQYLTASILGPQLADITSSVFSIAITVAFLKFYKIKNIYRLDGKTNFDNEEKMNIKDILKAWSPFIYLIIFIVIWTTPIIKTFASFADITFYLPYLKDSIIQTAPLSLVEEPVNTAYTFQAIKAIGLAILLAGVCTIFTLKIKATIAVDAAKEAFKEMFMPIVTIGLVVAYAFIAKNSAQAATMGLALANTGGEAFAFFSPVIGWIGVFLTGSVTSSNLLFGTLQQVTASQLNIPEIIFLAANTVGGMAGKMISPQSIAVACAAVGLVGRESELLKFTIKYSLIYILAGGIITWIILNLFPMLIPVIVS